MSLEPYAEWFRSSPQPYLLVGRDGVVVDASHGFLALAAAEADGVKGAFVASLLSGYELSPGRSFGTIKGANKSVLLVDISTSTLNGAGLFVLSIAPRESQSYSGQLDALARLAAGIAHDFNNTLMSALPWADVLRRKFPDESIVQKATDNIRRAIYRARDVTHQLLDFAQPKKLQRRTISATEVLDQQRDLVARVLPPQITLRVEPTPPDIFFDADPTQLSNALLQLTLNARDALPAGGSITLTGRDLHPDEARKAGIPARDYAAIEIRDTGPGVADELMPLIFDPFFTTKKSSRSVGLGLTVVHRFADQHGGRVLVHSTPEGASFVLVLPRARVEEESRPLPQHRKTLDGRKGLIIDDEVDVAEGLCQLLEFSGVQCLIASSGAAGLDELRRGYEPDFIILDFGLPDMPGSEVHRAIRQWSPSVPVVLSTGYAEAGSIEGLLQDSKTAYLRKPYELDDLLNQISQLVANPGQNSHE